MKIIAKIKTDMPEKFGIPRQSGLVPELFGKIVFEKEYNRAEALTGLEGFSHIWVLWRFSGFDDDSWDPTVRPPRLGGNKRIGVFATRSPNRPNPIGLSLVKLEGITGNNELIVSGVDMKDGTEIYDIKPYIKFTDCRPDAKEGYTSYTKEMSIDVILECHADNVSQTDLDIIIKLLTQDPHPSYKKDPERVYGMKYKDYNVKFKVCDKKIIVTEIK